MNNLLNRFNAGALFLAYASLTAITIADATWINLLLTYFVLLIFVHQVTE